MTIADWARLEFAPWDGIEIEDLASKLVEIPSDDPGVGVFSIKGAAVSVERLEVSRFNANKRSLLADRAELYTQYLEAVAVTAPVSKRLTLAIRLDDRGLPHPTLPLFSFQKRRFERSILLPDVDMLQSGIYAALDALTFSEKRVEAVFAGSTTGGIVSREAIEGGSHQRIRSAQFFKGKPGVRFELPVITQCDAPETEALLRAMELGADYLPWQQQLEARYLLSMDGNGAACSRLFRALCSNSALVKYASANLLYYFHGLEPWVHFIPVRHDAEVLDLVANAEQTAARDAAIAEQGRTFAESHLTYSNMLEYGAHLLARYVGLF